MKYQGWKNIVVVKGRGRENVRNGESKKNIYRGNASLGCI